MKGCCNQVCKQNTLRTDSKIYLNRFQNIPLCSCVCSIFLVSDNWCFFQDLHCKKTTCVLASHLFYLKNNSKNETIISDCGKHELYLENFAISSFSQHFLQLEVRRSQFDSQIDDIFIQLDGFGLPQTRNEKQSVKLLKNSSSCIILHVLVAVEL